MATWDRDLLGFEDASKTFTTLVQSVSTAETGSKVISIEAGFGRGKTFFREHWAQDLRDAGEVVVEIDARQSDHSGDPVVTFIGALVGALGAPESSKAKRFWDGTKKWGGVAARSAGGLAMGKAFEGMVEAADDILTGDDTPELLDDLVEGAGEGLSKAAKKMIGAQLAAEKARQELPEQLDALRKALTFRRKSKRVVVLIDELDRCHPDYAITLLEAMKLVFDRPGYVFVLMVNSDHLERIAAHRFVGWHRDEEDGAREPYLDKFVDMRLKLPAPEDRIGEAARALALELPEPEVPFGEGEEFTVERAAQVAAGLTPLSDLTMRQIKRVLLRVELAVRAYQGTPVDVPLLVALAFWPALVRPRAGRDRALFKREQKKQVVRYLPRFLLQSPDQFGERDISNVSELLPTYKDRDGILFVEGQAHSPLTERATPELAGLYPERYRMESISGPMSNIEFANMNNRFDPLVAIRDGLAPWYIPEHQAMLDHVHHLAAN